MSREPLFDINKIINEQLDRVAKSDNDSWGLLSLSQVQHSGAKAISDIINAVKNDGTVHFFTNGSFSLHELLVGALELTGPAKMYVSTYAMSETSTRCMAALIDNGLISEIWAVIDNRVDTRSAKSLQLFTALAKACVMIPCHAKATVLVGKHAHVLILGSANYTENARIETGLMTTNPNACDFHKDWIIEQIRNGRDNS